MKWNIQELQQKIQELENKINTINNQEEKYNLAIDLYNLKEMVNYSVGKNIYCLNEEDISYYHINSKYIEDINNFLSNYGKSIILSLSQVLCFNKIPSKASIIKKVNFSEYEELFIEFLQQYDFNLYNTYLKCKELNAIEINNKRYSLYNTSLGSCYYIAAYKKSYISVRNGKNVSNLTTLPHEVAHVYQHENVLSQKDVRNQTLSLLGEAFPIFIEYAFLDFLKTTKYRNLAFNREGERLDDLLCHLDYGADNLLKGSNKLNETSKLIISHVTALYWLEMYRMDNIHFLKEINEFNKNFGKEPVSNFFKNHCINDIADGVHSGICRYLSKYNKK